MKENIPGYPGYHITKDGKVYTHKSGVGNLEKLPIVLVLVVYELESILNGYKFLG